MGKNKSLTSEIRQKIVLMQQSGRSRNFIAHVLHLSKTAVNNAIKKYKDHGTFDDLQRKGRPRKTSLRDDLRIKRLCNLNPTASSGYIKRELGLEVAERNIRHRLQKVQKVFTGPKFFADTVSTLLAIKIVGKNPIFCS